jgi:hypothetical protein
MKLGKLIDLTAHVFRALASDWIPKHPGMQPYARKARFIVMMSVLLKEACDETRLF